MLIAIAVLLAVGVGVGIGLLVKGGAFGPTGGGPGDLPAEGAPNPANLRPLVAAVAKDLEVARENPRLQARLDNEVQMLGLRAVPELTAIVSSGTDYQKAVALTFLARLGPASAPALPYARALRESSPNAFVRHQAGVLVEALEGKKAQPEALVPGVAKSGRAWELVKLYYEQSQKPASDERAAEVCAKIVSEVKGIGKGAVHDLSYILRTGDPDEVVTALVLLTHIAPQAGDALPLVRQLAEHSKDPRIAEQAGKFLLACGQPLPAPPAPPKI